jgi:hypothetical protein
MVALQQTVPIYSTIQHYVSEHKKTANIFFTGSVNTKLLYFINIHLNKTQLPQK